MSDPADVVLELRHGLCYCGTIATRCAAYFHPHEAASMPFIVRGNVKNCPKCTAPIGGFINRGKIQVAAEFLLTFNGKASEMAVAVLHPVIDNMRRTAWLRPGVPCKVSDPAIVWLVATVAEVLDGARKIYRPEIMT